MQLLLLPGFMLDSDLWKDVEPLLEPLGDIYHADLSKDASIPDMARRALAEISGQFVVVGFSMGGYVAREIVRQAPERVSALILVATSARGDDEVQARRKAALVGQKAVEAFKGLSTAAVRSSLHPDNAGRNDLVSRIQEMGQRLGGEVFLRQSLLERHDERASLSNIESPTLIVAGDVDRLRSREEAVELHDGIKGSTLQVVRGTGHMIPMEAPRELAEFISTWLANLFPDKK